MKFIGSLIIMLLLCNAAYAGLISAVVGGAIAGSIVADGATKAGNTVASSIKGECLVPIIDTNNEQAAVSYNTIAGISSEMCDYPGASCDFWGGCARKRCYLIYFNDGTLGVYTFTTPIELIKARNELCR